MKTITLPSSVRKIYQAVQELEKEFPGRKFTPDGHLVGSIGEVVAAKAFNLKLLDMSYPGHDAIDSTGRMVQIKLTQKNRISMYSECERLIVMRVRDETTAEVIYDGCGQQAWDAAGKRAKNGQKSISLTKLEKLAGVA